METKPTTQEAYFKRYGYYSHMMPVPTKEEAIQHAMNTISGAFYKGKK